MGRKMCIRDSLGYALTDNEALTGSGARVALFTAQAAAGVRRLGEIALGLVLVLGMGAKAAVGVAALHQQLGVLHVQRAALRLHVGAHGAAHVRTLVMREPALAHGLVSVSYTHLVNYVALLGWSPGGEREIYSLAELEQVFDIHGLSKSPAIFDIEKLRWLNSEYIRAMSPEDFAKAAEPYIREAVKNPAIDLSLIHI